MKIFLFVPLVMVNIFNLSFIAYKLKGSQQIKEAGRILSDYFFGFHLIPLLLVISILILFNSLKKSSSPILYQLFMVFILFFMAVNFSLFPEIDGWFGLGKYDFKMKKNSSLEEAISKSPAKAARQVKSCIQLNKYLSGKTLVIPSQGLLEKDFFLKVFTTPKTTVEKEYDHLLAAEGVKQLSKFESITLIAFKKRNRVKEYIVITGYPHSDEIFLYAYNKSFVFVPSDLVNQISLNPDD